MISPTGFWDQMPDFWAFGAFLFPTDLREVSPVFHPLVGNFGGRVRAVCQDFATKNWQMIEIWSETCSIFLTCSCQAVPPDLFLRQRKKETDLEANGL